MDVYRTGGITIANAPGTGISDDKAIYSYMPEIVEFYTGERPLLQNVPTWRCSEPDALAYVLENLADLVVKEVHGSGGYGMLVGPAATKKDLAAFRRKLKARPATISRSPRSACRRCRSLRARGWRRGMSICGPSCWSARRHPRHARRPDTGGAEEGIAGRQLKPGGRHQGHLGAGGLRMLGKTANGLFWMYRNLERAEHTARLIETGQRLALTRLNDPDAEWRPVLQSASVLQAYLANNETVTARPSSTGCCGRATIPARCCAASNRRG